MNRRLLLPRASRIFGYAELWLEGDALLYVQSSRFTDRYSRFRLADVQALVLTEYALWSFPRALWPVLSFLALAGVMVSASGMWLWWGLAPGVSLMLATMDLLLGARCRLVLHTAVSAVPIDAVRRVRDARRLLPELRRLVESEQGGAGAGIGPRVEAVTRRSTAGSGNPVLLRNVLFGMVLAHALLLALFAAAKHSDDALGLSATLLVAEMVMGVLAAVRWRDVSLPVAGLSVLIVVAALADGGVLAFTGIKTFGSFVALVQRQGGRPIGGDMHWLWLREQTTARAVWHVLLGAVGWVLVLTRRESAV